MSEQTDLSPTTNATRPHTRIVPSDYLCAALILLTVLILGVPGITTGGLGWSDAPQHTFDGIFVLDFLRQRPFDNPRQWAEQFYLFNPALGIVAYWPPGFAIVEAAVFAVFGVSVAAARVTVLLFASGAGILMFSLGRRWFDRLTGLFAALLLITCPHGALWLGDVMLEWPAAFWLLAVCYAYQKDRDTLLARWAVALAAAVVMAFITKQTAGFILPVLLLHAILAGDRRRYLLRPAFIIPVVVAFAVIVGYTAFARLHAALPSTLLRPSTDDLLFYPRHMPEIVGWPLLPLAVLGLGTLIAAPDRRARGLLLLWFLAWVAFSTAISAKEPRYFFFALPPLMFAAVRFLLPQARRGEREQLIRWKTDAVRLALLVALVCTQAGLALARSTGRLPDYGPAVAALADRPDADLVLVDAVRDGQFVFDAYRNNRTRGRIIPLRASKLLYARAARMKYSGQIFARTEQDIIDLLDKYGIRYIVIESALPRTHYTDADPLPRKLLRRLLAEDPRFRLVDAWPLRCGDPIWDHVELRLYAYSDCPPRSSDTITLSFPGMGREITFRIP
ncbi:MAG: glycosyltransferase family 39 protein [Planctomycetota bacterium]